MLPRPSSRHVITLFGLLLILLPRAGAAAPQAATVPQSAAEPRTAGEPLTVMSFNIRYGTADDRENRWAARREFVFDLLREQAADVLGLQEALDFQLDEIAAALPEYAVIGMGRDDGARKGEYAAILVRRDRFQVSEAGTFWFSDTPSVAASTSWGNRITRICTWARLIDRHGRAFWVFNVHLDHESQPSREKSVRLLRERIDARRFPAEPVIVTGDFNAGEKNPALAPLAGAYVDTFRVTHPDEQTVGTATNFDPARIHGDKIDYIFVEPSAEVLSAAIIRTSRANRLPSDHFPVVARVRLAWPARR